jgi:hypothetical protein
MTTNMKTYTSNTTKHLARYAHPFTPVLTPSHLETSQLIAFPENQKPFKLWYAYICMMQFHMQIDRSINQSIFMQLHIPMSSVGPACLPASQLHSWLPFFKDTVRPSHQLQTIKAVIHLLNSSLIPVPRHHQASQVIILTIPSSFSYTPHWKKKQNTGPTVQWCTGAVRLCLDDTSGAWRRHFECYETKHFVSNYTLPCPVVIQFVP